MNNGDFYPTKPEEQEGLSCLDLMVDSALIVMVIVIILISGLFYLAAALTPAVIVPAGDCIARICA